MIRRHLSTLMQMVLLSSLALFAITGLFGGIASAFTPSYNPSFLISDGLFTDSGSMSVGQIQSFLISENSGLYNYHDTEDCSSNPTYMAKYYSCGKSVLASQIIYDASHAYGISPKVIMATLQKEQSLITTPDPVSSQLNCAMGYNSCSGVVGFFNQIDWGTWQFRTYIETMNGVASWNGLTWSSGFACGSATSLYSTGLYPGRTVTFTNPHYTGDPYSTSQPRTVTLETSATAALDCYTPYVGPYVTTDGYTGTGYSGSFNFVVNFEQWFGSVASVCYSQTNVTGADDGRKIMAFQDSTKGATNLAFTEQNNTGSTCTEVHLWASGYKSWAAHIATGMPATNPTAGTLLAGNFFGGKQDRLIYLKYSGSGGAMEVHMFSSDLQHFPGIYDVATTLTGANPSMGTFVAGDFLGRGYDQLLYIKYVSASGFAEIHMFSEDLRKVTGTYDAATDLPDTTATNGTFVAGDFLHKGYDQLAYIKYADGSGHAEVHLFDPSLKKVTHTYDVMTNLTGASANTGTFVAGDFLGRGYDQLEYIAYAGSSGKVEVHTFSPDLRTAIGYQDIATNMSSITLPL